MKWPSKEDLFFGFVWLLMYGEIITIGLIVTGTFTAVVYFSIW